MDEVVVGTPHTYDSLGRYLITLAQSGAMKAAKTRKLTEAELESGVFRHEVNVTFSFMLEREAAGRGFGGGPVCCICWNDGGMIICCGSCCE